MLAKTNQPQPCTWLRSATPKAKRKLFGSYNVLKNTGRLGRDLFFFKFFFYYFYSLTHMIPWSWMSSIKVCLVVIVFICSNCTPVHQEIDDLIVGELIFWMARLKFWVGTVHFSVGLTRKL